MRLLMLAICMLCMSLSPLRAAVSGGASPVGVSVTTPFLDETGYSLSLAQGALSNCFLTSIRIEGIDTCTIGFIPMICLRMRNNYPSNIMEASYKYQHLSVTTIAGMAQLEATSEPATPAKKLLGWSGVGDSNDGGSFSSMGRTQAIPLIANTVFNAVAGLSGGNLCQPTVFGFSYIFLSDAAEQSFGFSSWRPTVSPYWYHGITSSLTGMSKAVELTGFCGLDTMHLLCYGGYGSVYPGNGMNPAGSPMMNLLVSAWRAQEIHSPAFPTHGVYGTALGPIVWQLHDPRSFAFGATAQIPKYSPGSYVQWLYPGTSGTGVPDTACYPLGVGAGDLPPFFTQMATESLNRIPLQDMVLSFTYWSRWTCCNYCAASNESAGRHLVPEASFTPTLTRIP